MIKNYKLREFERLMFCGENKKKKKKDLNREFDDN